MSMRMRWRRAGRKAWLRPLMRLAGLLSGVGCAVAVTAC